MRHFRALPRSVAVLPGGMQPPAAKALLVARPRPAHTLTPRLGPAPPPAVALPAVAAPAHPHLLRAPLAREDSIACNAALHARPSLATRLDSATASRHGRCGTCVVDAISTPFQKARELPSRAFTFLAPTSSPISPPRATDSKQTKNTEVDLSPIDALARPAPRRVTSSGALTRYSPNSRGFR